MKKTTVAVGVGLGLLGAAWLLRPRRKVLLAGQTVVVIGAEGHLALAASRLLLKQAVNVAICASTSAELEPTRLMLGDNVLVYRADTTDVEQLHAFSEAVRAKYGRIDWMVAGDGAKLHRVSRLATM